MKGTRSEVINKLQDANKKLRAQVRQLRKQLDQASDEIVLLQGIWQSEIAELKALKRANKQEKKKPLCPSCGNPTLDITIVGVWRLIRCQSCDYFNRDQED